MDKREVLIIGLEVELTEIPNKRIFLRVGPCSIDPRLAECLQLIRVSDAIVRQYTFLGLFIV